MPIVCLYIFDVLYSTKVSRDKTFAVKSPCEYSQKNFHICISIAQNDVLKISKRLNILKFAEKHSRFKENRPANLLYYMVHFNAHHVQMMPQKIFFVYEMFGH